MNAEVKVAVRQNYYTNEDTAEILINLDKENTVKDVKIYLNGELVLNELILSNGLNSFSIPIKNLSVNQHNVTIIIPKLNFNQQIVLTKLPHKINSVKIDRKTGGLLYDDRYIFPFGFYCYSPVQSQIAELEVVKGFNLMSPYQEINRKNRKDRLVYMDRCAELGMKVHYNLCRVAGGGGVGSNGKHDFDADSEKLLIEEINYFKDHPALLGWYIADEPVGQNIPVSQVEKIYNIVKKLDPYHPVSLVFMTPSRAVDYKNAMDIVMTDPYPVPGGNITEISTIVKNLGNDFYLEKPIWLVPQAFGGNEFWKREPDWREMRMMTYQGIINDVKGIQYFIRHGYNSFPKSTAAWNEVAKISLEVRELSPFLLNYDEKIDVLCKNENIDISAWKKNNEILIGAINKNNMPQTLKFTLYNIEFEIANVPFEFREVQVVNGIIEDLIDGYGTRFYLLSSQNGNDYPTDLFINPGFEYNRNATVPAGCYAKVSGDPGATYFLDNQEVYKGENSLNIITPEKSTVSLSFYNSRLKKGNSYQISIMAKSDENYFLRKKSFLHKIKSILTKELPASKISIGKLGGIEFNTDSDWKKYSFFITNTSDEILYSPALVQNGAAKIWYDNFEIKPDPIIKNEIIDGELVLSVESDGVKVTKYKFENDQWQNYKEPVKLVKSGRFYAGIFENDQNIATTDTYFEVHKSLGMSTHYSTNPHPKYFPGGVYGLTDGIRATNDFRDGLWQGIEQNNLEVIIDLRELKKINELGIGFLQSTGAWIFMPEYVEFSVSDDGENFKNVGRLSNTVSQKESSPVIFNFKQEIDNKEIRYVKVFAKNIENCPPWHQSQGGKSFIFFDEIIIR